VEAGVFYRDNYLLNQLAIVENILLKKLLLVALMAFPTRALLSLPVVVEVVAEIVVFEAVADTLLAVVALIPCAKLAL